MEEPLLPPPPPLPPDPAEPPFGPPSHAGIPWEDRARLGFFPALIETIKLFVTAPQDGFARMKEKGDYLSPILFAVIVGVAGVLMAQVWSLLFGSSMLFVPGAMKQQMAPAMAGQGMVWFGILLVSPILVVVGLLIASGLFHLALLLLKGTDSSTAGFEGTLRVVAYSQVVQLTAVVPFVGGLLGLVWAIILYTLGLSAVHRTTQGKALAAVLLPLVLCCVCVLVIGGLAMGGLMAALAGAGTGN